MRWPWVSRDALERAECELAAERQWHADADLRAGAKEVERAMWERMQSATAANLQQAVDTLRRKDDAYAALEARYADLVKQVVDLKRAEAGLPPAAFDASLLDPMNSLGPKTQLAIDEFAGGDPEMKKYLVNRAHLELAAMRGQSDDINDIDKQLAAKIRRGDQ